MEKDMAIDDITDTEVEKTASTTVISSDDAVFIAIEMGKRILMCGGEVHRAEETISRICTAYGAVAVDVNAILSMIILTADFENEEKTSFCRVSIGVNNLGRLAKLNALSRRICAMKPSKEAFLTLLDEVERASSVGVIKQIIGAALLSIGFALYFGGNLLDAALSGLIAVAMWFIIRLLNRSNMNAIVVKFAACFMGGVGALLIGRTGINCNVNMIIIGDIMNVVPGVALTNSLRDLFGGDIMSGLFRLCTVLLDAVAIACGYAVAILIFGGAA
ncbi:MAG: threonine/serine exporter family protein [Ruminococcaceae bacterium]|nr:threonine/serine exporter family protein [Oscillospiraceae bacterium]